MKRLRLLLLFACLPLLQGCLTAHMWSTYDGDMMQVERELATQEVKDTDGAILTANPAVANGMTWIAKGGSQAFWLRPESGVEAASALLADPEFCKVERADVRGVRSYLEYDIDSDQAEVELTVRVDPETVGEEVPEASLPLGLVRLLEEERRNAFLLSLSPEQQLSDDYRACAQSLSAIDLGAVLGEPGQWHADNLAFVDADGRLDGSPPDRRNSFYGVVQRDPNKHERVHALRQRTMIVRARSRGRTKYLRLRPDRVWLLAGLQLDEGTGKYVHRSGWRLERVGPADALPPAGDAKLLASTLSLTERRYRANFVDGDDSFWGRVALTPVTLALDIVFGPPALRVWQAISGQLPRDDQIVPGGRRDP